MTVSERYACSQGHPGIWFDEVDWDCFDSNSNDEYYCPTCGGYGTGYLTRNTVYTLEEYARLQGQEHGERMRRLQQQIQDQESRNQEEISNISQQISQRQSSINSQRWAEENAISQRYQQTENNLRNEIQSQAQGQARLGSWMSILAKNPPVISPTSFQEVWWFCP